MSEVVVGGRLLMVLAGVVLSDCVRLPVVCVCRLGSLPTAASLSSALSTRRLMCAFSGTAMGLGCRWQFAFRFRQWGFMQGAGYKDPVFRVWGKRCRQRTAYLC